MNLLDCSTRASDDNTLHCYCMLRFMMTILIRLIQFHTKSYENETASKYCSILIEERENDPQNKDTEATTESSPSISTQMELI